MEVEAVQKRIVCVPCAWSAKTRITIPGFQQTYLGLVVQQSRGNWKTSLCEYTIFKIEFLWTTVSWPYGWVVDVAVRRQWLG